MKISILGHDWTVLVVDKTFIDDNFGNGTGITDVKTKTIYLRDDAVNFLHAAHELTHATNHYCCNQETEMTWDQAEEFMADFIGIHGEGIVKQAKLIVKELA